MAKQFLFIAPWILRQPIVYVCGCESIHFFISLEVLIIGKLNYQVNTEICDAVIRVLGPDGAQLGIMSASVAGKWPTSTSARSCLRTSLPPVLISLLWISRPNWKAAPCRCLCPRKTVSSIDVKTPRLSATNGSSAGLLF